MYKRQALDGGRYSSSVIIRNTENESDRETEPNLTGLGVSGAVSSHSSGDISDPTETASWGCGDDNALMSSWYVVIIDNNKRNCADSSQSMSISKVTAVNGSLAWETPEAVSLFAALCTQAEPGFSLRGYIHNRRIVRAGSGKNTGINLCGFPSFWVYQILL